MSKIGRQPITIPATITFALNGDVVSVKGPKGELSLKLHPEVTIKQEADVVTVHPARQTKLAKSLHGTFQRHIANMVTGVTEGYTKTLELIGTGYRVTKQGNKISLALGFSHPIVYEPPASVTLDVEGNNKIIVKGIDKQLVGMAASQIRSYKKPEPYKGKGIRYEGEVVRRKAGKAAKAAA